MEPAVAITHRVAWGATGRRWSRRSVSARSRFSLRALHGPAGRHDVLPAVLPAPGAGYDVVDVLGRAGCSTGSAGRRGRTPPGGTAAPGTGTAPARSAGQSDHGGHREPQALGVELGVIARNDDGLLLEDQHHRPPNRDHTERLEAGVEHQRSSQASRPPPIRSGRDCRQFRSRRPPHPALRPLDRHHRRYTTRSSGSGSPPACRTGCRAGTARTAASGTGRNGGAPPPPRAGERGRPARAAPVGPSSSRAAGQVLQLSLAPRTATSGAVTVFELGATGSAANAPTAIDWPARGSRVRRGDPVHSRLVRRQPDHRGRGTGGTTRTEPAGTSLLDRHGRRPGLDTRVEPLFRALVDNVEHVIQGKREAVHLALVCLLAVGPPADRGRARASARRRSPRRSPARSAAPGTGCSSRPTCSRRTSPACRCGTGSPASSSSGPAACSPTSSSPTRSTGPRPRPSPRCSRRWRSDQVTVDGVHLPARRAVHGDRHAEPDRARRHLSPARGAARPLPDAHRDGLPGPGRRGGDPRVAEQPPRGRGARAGRRPRTRSPRLVDAVVHGARRRHAAQLHRRPRRRDPPPSRPRARRESARRTRAAARRPGARRELRS